MSDNTECDSTLNMDTVSAILLDVAGTTTAISFVKETIYSYVIKNVETFLKNSWESDDVKKAIEHLEEKDLDATKAAEVVKDLTEKDDCNIGLKSIQALLSKKGYESGDLKGHVFKDVPKFLASWSATKQIAIFSSGSVESQQLLFKNSTEGDLTPYIKKFFDLSVGSKTDSETYKKIAKELEITPAHLLFFTDDLKEIQAAKTAGVNIILVEREGNAQIPEDSKIDLTVVKSFAENLKRKISDVETSNEEPPSKIARIVENDATVEITECIEPEEKKELKVVEAMEVDAEPIIIAEKVEKFSAEYTTDQNALTSEEAKSEKQSETMELDFKQIDLKTNGNDNELKQTCEEPTNKSESEIGTQTKSAVTSECETQTTISLAAADELPIEKVEDILMSSEEILEQNKLDNEDKEKKLDETDNSGVEEKIIERVEKTNIEVHENNVGNQHENGDLMKVDEEVEGKSEDNDKTEENTKEAEKEKMEAEEDVKETKTGSGVVEDLRKVEESKTENDEVEGLRKGNCEVAETKKENDEVEGIRKGNGEDAETKKGNDEVEKPKKEVEKNDKEIAEEDKKSGVDDNDIQENDAVTATNHVEYETKEKENKSQLANGKEDDVSNSEVVESKNGTKEVNEEEIKIKKIGDNVESVPVSVEA